MNYRRIIIYTLVVYTLINWLFQIDILQSYSKYKILIAIATILFFYFLKSEKKDEFLFVAILFVLFQPILDYLFNLIDIGLDTMLLTSTLLIAVSWRIDSINITNIGENIHKSDKDYFNLVYLNSAKSYEIATLIDDTVKTTIQKENNNTRNNRKFFKIGVKNSLQSGYENINELTTESKISESFEIKTTKSTIFRKVFEMSQSYETNMLMQGDLVKFNSISLDPVNAQDIPLILQVLQSSKLDNPTSEGIELNMSNLLSTFLTDYTIDYSFKQDNEEFLVRFPYGEIEGFENGYHHSDFQLGKYSLVGIDRGKINFSEVDTISTKFLEFMSKKDNKDILTKTVKESVPKSSVSGLIGESDSEFAINFNYKKLSGEYRLIDVIAIVQKINVENKS